MGLQGCALAAAPLLGSVASSGAGAAVKSGADYESGGTFLRTFASPLADVRTATLATLDDLGITVSKDEPKKGNVHIVGEATKRKVEVTLEPVTRQLTRMRLTVKEGWFRRDKPTASQIMVQARERIERSTATASAARYPRRASSSSR